MHVTGTDDQIFTPHLFDNLAPLSRNADEMIILGDLHCNMPTKIAMDQSPYM